MRFLSICSGIEAASVAWEPLGFEPVGYSEIEAAPNALLAYRFPHVRNYGDFTSIPIGELGQVDWIIGGTPCQAFSVAGKRLSLDDVRGNLSLAYVVLVHELARSNGLRGAVWENVPGVLNTKDNAFGCFLGALVGHDSAFPQPRGAGWPSSGMADGPRGRAAWIVRDAQYFGLAQRRKRVFVVAGFGGGVDPAAILFERKGLRGDSPPSREAGQGIAATPVGGTDSGRNHGKRSGSDRDTMIAHSLPASDGSEDGTGRGTPLVPICFSAKDHGADAQIDLCPTLRAGGFTSSHANAGVMPAVAFDLRGREGGAQFEGPHDTANIRAASGGSSRSYVAFQPNDPGEHNSSLAPTMRSGSRGGCPGSQTCIASQWAVRRLTPVECERLQGFPDDWTLVPNERGGMMADGPRYKMLGNSMAVPVIRWIGKRMADFEFTVH